MKDFQIHSRFEIADQNKGGFVGSFHTWKSVPTPVRGLLVKDLASEINPHRDSLDGLITLEMGKCKREVLGEVQEYELHRGYTVNAILRERLRPMRASASVFFCSFFRYNYFSSPHDSVGV